MLEVDRVTQCYGSFRALDQVSFTLPDGQILGVIGPNGAGKTTLLNVIAGSHPATEGRVMLDGRRIDRLRQDAVARLGVGRTFQNLRLFRGMTVREHLMAAQNRLLTVPEQLWLAPEKKRELAQKLDELLAFLGLEQAADVEAATLSYGDCRRVEIARALALSPKLLLLDEPCAGMNGEESAALSALLRAVRDRFSLSILLIEHDMDMVQRCCEHVVVLNYGHKLAEGSFREVARQRAVREAYLGEEDA